MKKIGIFLLLLFCTSCGEEQKNTPVSHEDSEFKLSDSIHVNTNQEVELLPSAREQVLQWLAYATAQNEIENLKVETGNKIVKNAKPLVQIMEELQNTLPDTLRDPTVEARINVLVNKAHVLFQYASRRHQEPKKIFEVSNELIEEFGNFKLQLNELFMKDLEDFESELDIQFKEARDSLQQLSIEKNTLM